MVLIGVVGATGTTGRAVSKALHSLGHQVALIGRNPESLRRHAEALGGAEIRMADAVRPESMVEALDGVHSVVSCVAPYTRVGLPVAVAAVTAGTNYVDVTGEPRFVLDLVEKLDERARERGVALVPGVGASCVTGDVAAADAVSRIDGPVRALRVGYRLPPMRPSRGTASSYPHILADGAPVVRGGVLRMLTPGSRVADFPSGRGLTAPMVDTVAIARWCEAPEVETFILAPGAPMARHLACGASRLARIRLVRQWWERAGQRLPDRHDGGSGRETFSAEAVAVGVDDAVSTRVQGEAVYPFTARAAALVASRLTAGITVGGVCGPSQVLDRASAEKLGLRFEQAAGASRDG